MLSAKNLMKVHPDALPLRDDTTVTGLKTRKDSIPPLDMLHILTSLDSLDMQISIDWLGGAQIA